MTPGQPSLRDNAIWFMLGSLVILGTIGGAFIKFKRDRTSNEIARRILGISLELREKSPVTMLMKIREEIEGRVRRRWWRSGELDKTRWRDLHELIENRARESRENLTRALVRELRRYDEDDSSGDAERLEHRTVLAQRISQRFEAGELDALQRELLMKLVQEESNLSTLIKGVEGHAQSP